MAALPNVTGRPQIVGRFPNGTIKLYCPCGAVITCRPESGEGPDALYRPPQWCAFCRRRLAWPGVALVESLQDAPQPQQPQHSQSAVQSQTRHVSESVESRVPLVATCPVCWESEPCLCERSRSYRRHSRTREVQQEHAARRQLERLAIPRALSRDTHNLRPLPVAPRDSRCAHSPDQIGGRRCIRCCATKQLRYVYRRPAGGASGGYRYLCEPCAEVYMQLGLIDAGAQSDGRSTA